MKGGIYMNSILDDLYYGKIQPWEKAMVTEGEYSKAVAALTTAERKLFEVLQEEDRSLLESLIKAQGELLEWSCKEYYSDGVRFGIRLMAAVYEQGSKNLKSNEE
jgi:hypothetical protein